VVPLDDRMKEALDGVTVVSLGKPFNRPGFAATFVPYEIRFKSGRDQEVPKKYNLAIRRDKSSPGAGCLTAGGRTGLTNWPQNHCHSRAYGERRR